MEIIPSGIHKIPMSNNLRRYGRNCNEEAVTKTLFNVMDKDDRVVVILGRYRGALFCGYFC